MASSAHPFLKAPELFVDLSRTNVSENQLRKVLEQDAPSLANIQLVLPQSRTHFFKITFRGLHAAERTLAVLHMTQQTIPASGKVFQLELSTKPPRFSPLKADAPTAIPRLVKGWTDSPRRLFDVLRRFGPIFRIRKHPIVGALVQFWLEDHAREAQMDFEAMEVYNPCTVLCSNLALDVGADVLRSYFEKYDIVNVEIMRTPGGSSTGCAMVVLGSYTAVDAAVAGMNGSEIHWKKISVTPYYAKPSIDDAHLKSACNIPKAKEPTNVCAQCKALQQRYDQEVAARIALQIEVEQLRGELGQTTRARDDAQSLMRDLEVKLERVLEEQRKRDEAERMAEVKAMRKRMEEMAAQERAEREAKRRKVKEAQDREEMLERERVERLKKEQEEEERREREEREALNREKDRIAAWHAATLKEEKWCRERAKKARGKGVWTAARAISRLKILMDEFDACKYSEAQPLTKGSVPWPVLTDPTTLRVGDITWESVERFCNELDSAEYKSVVERLHRMFHPDKWKARRMLATVMDNGTRAELEAAANRVAQALTPLWRRSKGYD
ncbi:hypothetical protein MKEN_01363800 [Mycena kentingensis (nom. inval.)]|nr:hypothetical protein MKEN_01363800 [Mycena kentingensis (nom. inval.)]